MNEGIFARLNGTAGRCPSTLPPSAYVNTRAGYTNPL
jgi:hypothetical protein